jgi:hypothetical protein
MSQVQDSRPITRADIEAKLREIQSGAEVGKDAAKGGGLVAVVGLAVLGVVVAYLIGRRRGRKRRTFVEIRRV